MKKPDAILLVVIMFLATIVAGIWLWQQGIRIMIQNPHSVSATQALPTAVPTSTVARSTPTGEVLFGEISLEVNAQVSFINLSDEEVVIAGNVERGLNQAQYGAGFLSTAPENVQIPVSDNFGPPVIPGEYTRLTWGDANEDRQFLNSSYFERYGWQHLGTDLGTSNGLVAAIADSVVLAVYENLDTCESEKLGSAGRTVVLATKTSGGKEIHHTYGHLAFPDQDGFGVVYPGQYLSAGQTFARMGNTYNPVCGSSSSGAHLHLQTAVDDDKDGQYVWEDPLNYNVVGPRSEAK